MYRPDLIYEVCSVTIGNSFALRPCAESTDLILGVYGKALDNYPAVRLHALNPISTHDTSIISSTEPVQIKGFLSFVKSNISKELRRLHRLPYGVFAGKRAQVLPIGPDKASQLKRFRYVLAQGTKEDLVASPRDWPGVTGVHALETGQPLIGTWYDRAAEHAARHRGETFDKDTYATKYEVRFSPLPCWEDLSIKKWREKVTAVIDEIEETEARRRARTNKTVLGAAAVNARSPTEFPTHFKKSPSPMVLSATDSGYKALRRAFDTFCELFRKQAKQLREDPDARVEFPPFSFPPARPMTDGPALDLQLDRAFEPG